MISKQYRAYAESFPRLDTEKLERLAELHRFRRFIERLVIGRSPLWHLDDLGPFISAMWSSGRPV